MAPPSDAGLALVVATIGLAFTRFVYPVLRAGRRMSPSADTVMPGAIQGGGRRTMADIDREREVLLGALRGQRRHVLGILEGLPEEALRRPVLPSGWSCLGLVHHLALDVEQFWFRGVIAGEPEARGGWPDAWQVAGDVPAGQVLDRYRDETARADAIIAASPLSRPAAWWPADLPGSRLQDLREIIVHVITETATHAGHLDAARELTDGRTWLVLD